MRKSRRTKRDASGADASSRRRRGGLLGGLFRRRGGNRRVRSAEPRAPFFTRIAASLSDGLRRRRRLVVGVFAAASLITLLGGVGRVILHSTHFAVHAVRVSPQLLHTSDAALIERAAIPMGAHIFAVDLAAVEARLSDEPWLAEVHARRELPATIAIEVRERVPAAVAALGALYLVDRSGVPFKRATPDEAASWPLITGIERERYIEDPSSAHAELQGAIAVLAAWGHGMTRPPIGELHVGGADGVTLYTRAGGVGVRLGRVDESLPARLQRFDAVWAALDAAHDQPRLLYIDNRARPDRVTVKLAAPVKAAAPAKKDSET